MSSNLGCLQFRAWRRSRFLNTYGSSARKPSARTLRLAALLLGQALVASPSIAQVDPSIVPIEQRYDIAAQPLDMALDRFTEVSGVDLLYDHRLATNRRSTELSSVFSPQRALKTLLASSGLVARFTGPRSAVILSVDPHASGADGPTDHAALQLNTARITASPLIGGPPRSPFESYGLRAQDRILRRLQDSNLVGDQVFRIRFWARIAADGKIESLTLAQGTGDLQLDRRIRDVLLRNSFLPPPPSGIPQPLRFEIAARNAKY